MSHVACLQYIHFFFVIGSTPKCISNALYNKQFGIFITHIQIYLCIKQSQEYQAHMVWNMGVRSCCNFSFPLRIRKIQEKILQVVVATTHFHYEFWKSKKKYCNFYKIVWISMKYTPCRKYNSSFIKIIFEKNPLLFQKVSSTQGKRLKKIIQLIFIRIKSYKRDTVNHNSWFSVMLTNVGNVFGIIVISKISVTTK